ncbi:MAG TPA: hypothetical protein VLO29_05580 [Salegentibacter sp.]|nr:hypothetical protein [Salegentibacter sp.]
MKKTTRNLLYIFAGIGLLALILFGLNNFAEKQLKTGIEEASSQINLEYEKLDVNLLRRKAVLESPSFSLDEKNFKAEKLSLTNIEILKYIKNKDLEIGQVLLEAPNLKINQSRTSETNKDSTSGFKKNLLIRKLLVKNGKLAVVENDSADNSFFTHFSELEINQFQIDSNTVRNILPFNYEDYTFKGDSLFYKLDSRHNLNAGSVNITRGNSVIKDFRITSIYSKQKFQQQIPYQLDRFDLVIAEISLSNLDFEFINDSLSIENPLTEIKEARLSIYRDKLQPDDTRKKKMYSQMLRESPLRLKLDTIRLSNSYIKYEELIDGDRAPGEIDFSQLNASIYNLTNIENENYEGTEVDVQTRFMQEANLSVNWKFDIQNKTERFNISGNMDRISEESMNRFLKPAMNVLAKGSIQDMAFNYSGNGTEAIGDMRLVYQDFKVEVLRDDGTRKNKILSALANLIMNNDAMSEDVNQEQLKVTRDKTRSFWNYLWKMIREGALKSFF